MAVPWVAASVVNEIALLPNRLVVGPLKSVPVIVTLVAGPEAGAGQVTADMTLPPFHDDDRVPQARVPSVKQSPVLLLTHRPDA